MTPTWGGSSTPPKLLALPTGKPPSCRHPSGSGSCRDSWTACNWIQHFWVGRRRRHKLCTDSYGRFPRCHAEIQFGKSFTLLGQVAGLTNDIYIQIGQTLDQIRQRPRTHAPQRAHRTKLGTRTRSSRGGNCTQDSSFFFRLLSTLATLLSEGVVRTRGMGKSRREKMYNCGY